MINLLNRKEFLRLLSLFASGSLLKPQKTFAEIFNQLELSKHAFGTDFLWGVSTAAYQMEGAYQEDGKSNSIWDTFTQKHRHVKDGSTGNIACDFYHTYASDIDIVKSLNMKVFRFSTAWSRVLPNGIGQANQKGIDFYHRVIDKCLENKIILSNFKEYHNIFLSYFIFDTILLWYQVYLRIEKNIRIDLLLHHFLAITALIIIDNYGLYSISLMIGLSEGMSLVTGPKLLSMYYGNKYLTNIFIIYRLLYLIFIRMLFIWPSLIYFYNNVTLECDKYKNDRNIFLVIFLVIIIIHAEINWLHSGRKELARI
jgi:hypothetical protein